MKGNCYILHYVTLNIQKMQIDDITQKLFSTELFDQLKKSYDKRCEELGAAFVLAIKKLENSQILNQMKGEELMEYRLQHMKEISKQVMMNEQEMHMEQYMRTISELKTQLAIQKKKFQLTGKKFQENENNKSLKCYQEEIQFLKRQLSMKDVNQANPESFQSHQKIDKIYQGKLAEIKIQHADNQQIQNKLLMQKYEKVINLQKKKYEQGLQQNKQYFKREMKIKTQKYQTDINSLQKDNRNLKIENQRLIVENEFLTKKTEQLIKNSTFNTFLLSSSLKQMNLLENTASLQPEHFKSRVKKQTTYTYTPEKVDSEKKYEQKSIEKKQLFIPQLNPESFKQKQIRIPIDQQIVDKKPLVRQQRSSPRKQKVGTKFEQIQSSFAKELADLRTKMSSNKQKFYSPNARRSRPIMTRDSSLKRRAPESTKYQYSSKYVMKSYHHY